jgi:methylaspartate ammonia-lyase
MFLCMAVQGTDTFVQLKGAQTKDVTFKGNNFKHVKNAMIKEDAVKENIVVD